MLPFVSTFSSFSVQPINADRTPPRPLEALFREIEESR